MRLYFRRLFRIGVGLGILIPLVVLLILYPFYPQVLIELRFALFSNLVPDTAVFDRPPAELYARGFLRDAPDVISNWGEVAARELVQCERLPAGFAALPTLEKAKTLAQANSGGEGVRKFTDHETLIDRLNLVPKGAGHCSDVAETFLALCSVHGIDAYEFSTTPHTIAAVYCPELGRWVTIDPQFCILMRDARGAYLSPAQLRAAAFSARPIEFEFFGDPAWHTTHGTRKALQYYDNADDFREYTLTFGNNVFAVDEVRRTLRWIPKPVRQLYYWAIGVMPEYEIVNDQHALRGARLPILRRWMFSILAVLTIMIVPHLVLWTIGRLSRKPPSAPENLSEQPQMCRATTGAS